MEWFSVSHAAHPGFIDVTVPGAPEVSREKTASTVTDHSGANHYNGKWYVQDKFTDECCYGYQNESSRMQ